MGLYLCLRCSVSKACLRNFFFFSFLDRTNWSGCIWVAFCSMNENIAVCKGGELDFVIIPVVGPWSDDSAVKSV